MKLLQTWKKLYRYMLPEAPSFWWGMVTAFIGIIILHFSNYYLRHFVDALSSGNRDLAWQSLLVIVISYFSAQVLMFVGQMWESNWNGSWDALRKLRERLFIHLQDLDFSFHSNKSSGALISILKQGENAFSQMAVEFHFRVLPTILEVVVV